MARRRQPTDDGATQGDYWDAAIAAGSTEPTIQAPPFPHEIGHVYDWLWQLHGRSGASMGGLLPISWPTLDAFARLGGVIPTPDEVTLLMACDAILLIPAGAPSPSAERGSERAITPRPMPIWPMRHPRPEPPPHG